MEGCVEKEQQVESFAEVLILEGFPKPKVVIIDYFVGILENWKFSGVKDVGSLKIASQEAMEMEVVHLISSISKHVMEVEDILYDRKFERILILRKDCGHIEGCVAEWKATESMRGLYVMIEWTLCFMDLVSNLLVGIGECTAENGQVDIVIANREMKC